MRITTSEARERKAGSTANFTGDVEQTVVHVPEDPARTVSGMNTFSPSARTVWHTHPLGQVLFIVSGKGRVQVWGEPAREVRAGDTVYFPPGEKHWHGAAPDAEMAHISITEMQNGSAVDWMEPVTDSQYENVDP